MKHVIIGNGPAGLVAAETLRRLQPDAEIVARVGLDKIEVVGLCTTGIVAKIQKTLRMPSEYQKLSKKTRRRSWPPCSTNDSTLRPMTGSTHGMKLRMKPANRPTPSMTGSDDGPSADLTLIWAMS